jgi:hypothetical protein
VAFVEAMVMACDSREESLRTGDLIAKTECGGHTEKSESCRLGKTSLECHLRVSSVTDKSIACAWKSRVSFFEVEGSARLLDIN